jgi:hypothetical protein
VKKKLYIAVEVFQLIINDVHVFTDLEKAKAWFKEYTGFDYVFDEEGSLPEKFYNGDYDQTKIFETEVDL